MPSLVPVMSVGPGMVPVPLPQGAQIPPPPMSCQGLPCQGVQGMSLPSPVMFSQGPVRPPSFPPGIPPSTGNGLSGQGSTTDLLIGMCMSMMQQMQLQQQQMQQQQQQLFQAMQDQQQQFMAMLSSRPIRMHGDGVSGAGLGSSAPEGGVSSGGAPAEPAGRDEKSLFKSIDSKILPSMPVPDTTGWTTRPSEILGFHGYLDQLTAWIGMMQPEFSKEVREAVSNPRPIQDSELFASQRERSSRLYYILKQGLEKSPRVQSIIKLHESSLGVSTSTNGYRLLQKLKEEYSLQTRSEALHFRSCLLNFRVKSGTSLKDVLNVLDAEWISSGKIFETAVDTSIVRDILPAEPERYRWLLQNISSECRRYVQLHAVSETYADAKTAVSNFYAKTVLSEQDFSTNKGLSLSALGETFEPVEPVLGAASSIDPKDRECWNCRRKGHMAKDCRQPKRSPSPVKGKGKVEKVEKGEKGKEKGKGEKGKSKGGKPSGGKKGKGKDKKGLRSAEYFDLATPEESEQELDLDLEAKEYEALEEDGWSEASEPTEPIRLSVFVREEQKTVTRSKEQFLCTFELSRCSLSDTAAILPPSDRLDVEHAHHPEPQIRDESAPVGVETPCHEVEAPCHEVEAPCHEVEAPNHEVEPLDPEEEPNEVFRDLRVPVRLELFAVLNPCLSVESQQYELESGRFSH